MGFGFVPRNGGGRGAEAGPRSSHAAESGLRAGGGTGSGGARDTAPSEDRHPSGGPASAAILLQHMQPPLLISSHHGRHSGRLQHMATQAGTYPVS